MNRRSPPRTCVMRIVAMAPIAGCGRIGARAAGTAMLCALLAGWGAGAAAADVTVTVTVLDNAGHGVAGIVIIAESDAAVPEKHAVHTAIMDQQHMQFVPRVLVVQTG